MDEFAGKVAVITGGGSGIGLATAKALAREGMKIVIADIEPGAIEWAVAEVQGFGVEAMGVRTDVTKLPMVQELADKTWERFGAATCSSTTPAWPSAGRSPKQRTTTGNG